MDRIDVIALNHGTLSGYKRLADYAQRSGPLHLCIDAVVTAGSPGRCCHCCRDGYDAGIVTAAHIVLIVIVVRELRVVSDGRRRRRRLR